MVDYKYSDLFYERNVDKQLKIATDDELFTATNSDIKWENFELKEGLCSDSELQFGSCEASSIKFQILNAFIPLSGKWLTVTETIGGNTDVPFQYGRYKVFSDVPTADREYRDIVAYDAMYDIINSDVTAWYNTILPNKNSKVTLKVFRESFISYFNLSEVVPKGGLVNDNMIVERTIDPEGLSGKNVITAICEINGCFGHIGRDGKFHYIYMIQNIQGIYPADFLFPDHVPEQWNYLAQAETGHLYPQDPKAYNLNGKAYIKCKYEDYHVRQINKLQIRKEENDIGVIYGNGDNCYIIQDNFLVYGKGTDELGIIAENIFNKITGIVYRPINCDAVGNPCLEVGDPIRFPTKYEIIDSYILSRRIKGILSPRDTYTASGSEKRSERVNGVQRSIIDLKGKTNVLDRTIEETRSELMDADNALSSRITQNANSITAEVTRAQSVEGNLSSRITVNEQGISQRVVKGTVSSEISQEAGQVAIRSNRLIVDSNQFHLDGNGNATFSGTLTAANGSFSGTVNADSGTFNNVTISDSCTVAGQSIVGAIGNGVGWYGASIEGGYIGSGINGGNVTAGTVASGRIADTLFDKSIESGGTGHAITIGDISSLACSITSGSYNVWHNAALNVSIGSLSGSAKFAGDLTVSGKKSRSVITETYGERLLYCYEMPSPVFGDMGEGKTDETGTCMIFLDDIFAETIDSDCQYQVFLQEYGPGKCYVVERTPSYFIVKGDASLQFGWEAKAIQKDYDTMRLEQPDYEEENDIELELMRISESMEDLLYNPEKESEEIL